MNFNDINKKNIETFKTQGVDYPEKKNYTCVLCNRKVSCGESHSRRGDRLICSNCIMWNFPTYKDARNWITEEDDNE